MLNSMLVVTLRTCVLALVCAGLLLPSRASAQNQALFISGTPGGVDVPGSPSLNLQAAYTFEAWQYYLGAGDYIFRKDGYDRFTYHFAGSPTTIGVGVNWSSPNEAWCSLATPNGTPGWAHFAASFDGVTLSLYRNGLLVKSCAMPPPDSNAAIPLHIGYVNSAYGGLDYFNGWLDEVRIWNVARTQLQIAETIDQRIDATNAGNYPGLVACWNFEGDATDATGVNHGAAFGTAAFVPALNIPDLDCDDNGIVDAFELGSGTAFDCNGNGVIDSCDISAGTSQDCNGNGVPDECDIASGLDCNGNGIPDICDIVAGTSPDPNGNGIPEECESSVTTYCSPAAPNSVSPTGSSLTVQGIPSTILNNLVFNVSSLPPNKPGLFVYAPFQNHLPAGNGFLCLGGVTVRVQPALISSPQGAVSHAVDLTQFPFTGSANTILPGSTWNFQFWHRDPTGGLFGFNFSDAARLTFAP